MAPSDNPDIDDPTKTAAEDADPQDMEAVEADAEEGEEQAVPLTLEVEVEEKSACERHITVTVSREDIDRYLDKQFSELMPKAEVPGFRPGHAPRKLVEMRFRKEASEQVKNELLMDSIAQVSEEEGLSAISEPDLDPESVVLPEEGPLVFEFELEVRPSFELPKWKGLLLERPVCEFTAAHVDSTLERVLSRYGRLVPHEGAAELGDFVTCNLAFVHEDREISRFEEELIRIRPVLSLRDGRIENFDQLMVGATAGETRETTLRLSDDAPNEALRGQEMTAQFEILDVKRLELPELTPRFLDEIGEFESEADLRDAIQDNLQRRLEYEQRQRARQQITALLTEAATWELPPELLERQSHREMERAVMELRSSGFSEEEICAHENELRQNSRAATARALKEHFILERIAEDEEIDVTEEDYEAHIRLLALQRGENPRRVRARLEKEGRMDVLRNQIIEEKVIDLILKHAEFKDVPWQPETPEAEALDRDAGGSSPAIPQAKPETSE